MGLNRRYDAQFFLVWLSFFALCVLIGFSPLIGMPFVGAVVSLVIVAVSFWLLDVWTVRLVVPGRWRGFLGYEAQQDGAGNSHRAGQ